MAAQLNTAVAKLTTSEAWLSMLRVAKFTRYSPSNVLPLWMQAEQRGVTLSRVAGYRDWQGVGRQVVNRRICAAGGVALSRSPATAPNPRQ